MKDLGQSAVEVFEELLLTMPLETIVKTCVGCPETSKNIEATIRQVSEL